jgi:nucleotide-binding universal stress UspA family protein
MNDEQQERPPLGEESMRRLLVAIDGSASSELALSTAVRAAKLDNAALTLITVEPDVSTEAFRWSAGGTTSAAALQQEVHEDAERTLREAVERIPEEIPVRKIHRFGKAGPAIVEVASAGGYDAVLIGARGVGRVGALLGSVSNHVLHHAPIHVLVVRD